MTTMATESLSDILARYCACRDARQWAAQYMTLIEAWAACDRADWMLWLAGRMAGGPESESRKRLVLCACACARTALVHVKAGETRPLAAIETAERWARGEAGVTLADVRAAVAGAVAAAAAVAGAVAAAAAGAGAAAAAGAAADAAAGAGAAVAADAAADAAAGAGAVAAWRSTRATRLKELADLVRQHYPEPPQEERA